MKHLIDIKSISKEEIENIINLAKEFKTGRKKSDVEKKTLSLMFYENSTRTRCSFEIAAQKLGMNIINFDANHSSLSKGESLKDTIENLYFLGVDAVVIRHSLSGIINNVMRLVKYPIHFVNGGDGTHAHPSQALLDYYTMLEKIGSVEGKRITIVGDVSHSRVAKSNISLLSNEQAFNIHYHNEVKEAIDSSNVVMVLRVQNERHEKEGYPDSSEYKRLYEIDTELLKKYAAKDVILMHPGPANRNIEVSSELLDNQVGKTILEQAQNGVYVRMAILNTLLKGDNNAS